MDIYQKLKVNFSSVSRSMQELITPQSTDSKDYVSLKEICFTHFKKGGKTMLSSGYNMVFAVKTS